MLTHSMSVIHAKARQMHVTCGAILEIGPGRVWPGLEWLQQEPDLELTGAGYSAAECNAALAHARKLGVIARAQYPAGDSTDLPLKDRSVDAVVSFGGLHAWARPVRVLDEIARVLKIGGKFFIGDVRRDMNWLANAVLSHLGSQGLKDVYRARDKALTLPEVKELFDHSRLRGGSVQALGSDVWVLSE